MRLSIHNLSSMVWRDDISGYDSKQDTCVVGVYVYCNVNTKEKDSISPELSLLRKSTAAVTACLLSR